jgi:hypothetical protein
MMCSFSRKSYISTPSLTSALDVSVWLTSLPGSFTHGNDLSAIVQEAWLVPGSVWTGAENYFLPEFDSCPVQPVASRCY